MTEIPAHLLARAKATRLKSEPILTVPTQPVAFIDTETTGLDPDRHEIWDVGLIVDEEEYQWFLPVDLSQADTMALNIGQYHNRMEKAKGERHFTESVLSPLPLFARDFVGLTRGKHLVGAIPSFDAERLRKLLRANGQCEMWHYHLVCVENLVAGKLGIEPPWKSDELSVAIGVDPTQFEKHTALGDARWAKAMYEAVYA